ncbi:general secretion pathway protein GspM [Gluconacetobacter azotocaptans]|uniref:General secretion pathway protein GspM n=1 Tax=Gluconacetobacter azotocaptans TaxID=142834 RepID=A0A7W4PFX3_9PROT|nr:type II secretion system protein GspM [Gluconacetobacter azotocaptans]MBB2191009.1 general secretion pathway protein GspM [Gluconacetobacter azotocaptans]MBM9401931.1 type II secretion system protein M [Gluconacetobacter azotocaptans]GBQ29562.1 general secretion pathway protein M [Gluconacetobacter azotocaptans DSM 13594]
MSLIPKHTLPSRHALIRALPEGRPGRLAALGLSAVVVMLAWLLVVAPLWGWYAQRAESLGIQRDTVARMEALSAALPGLRRAAATSAPGPALLIGGATDAIASANLEETLQQTASSMGASISSAENVPAATIGPYQRIGLHIVVSAAFPTLVRLIATLERSSPAVVIDALHIHKSEDENTPATMMECDMSVYAFRRTDSSAPPPAAPAP